MWVLVWSFCMRQLNFQVFSCTETLEFALLQTELISTLNSANPLTRLVRRTMDSSKRDTRRVHLSRALSTPFSRLLPSSLFRPLAKALETNSKFARAVDSC